MAMEQNLENNKNVITNQQMDGPTLLSSSTYYTDRNYFGTFIPDMTYHMPERVIYMAQKTKEILRDQSLQNSELPPIGDEFVEQLVQDIVQRLDYEQHITGQLRLRYLSDDLVTAKFKDEVAKQLQTFEDQECNNSQRTMTDKDFKDSSTETRKTGKKRRKSIGYSFRRFLSIFIPCCEPKRNYYTDE